MKNKYLFFAFVFLFMSSGLFSQTKLIVDNDNKGSKISDSGGLQQVWDSKTKIVKSKSWGDDFFYVIWADTGTLGTHSPLAEDNANEENLPNASIFAVKMIKSGNTYIKDDNFGTNSLLVITDRFDQSLREINAFPNGNGFVIMYSTSAQGAVVEGFVQYYNNTGVAQISSVGDGGTGNTAFKLPNFNYHFPFTVSGGYAYYVYTDSGFKVNYCSIEESPNCSSITDLGLESEPANGFLIPYSHSTAPGVILGVQHNWGDGKFNIKIKRITPTPVSSDWIAVTNTGGVYVEDDEDRLDGNMQGFYEEGGASYVIWADTATDPTSIRIGKITVDGSGGVVLSTNDGQGYLLAEVDVSSMSANLDDSWYAANNDKIGLIYLDGDGKKFGLFDAANNFSIIGNPVSLSNTDLEDDQKFYFSINDAGYVSIFERDNAGNGGSLKVSGYKADMTQIFPPTVFLSSSTIDKTYYSYAGVEGVGNYFAVLEHESVGSDSSYAYNLYSQVLSTAVPPLEDLTSPAVDKTGDMPLAFTFKAYDPNNIVGSTYTVQVSTVSDFSTIIYSTDVINANENNPKTLLSINGLTPGRTYYFRAKVRYGDIESGYSDTSKSDGTEGDHRPELGIAKWSADKINNAVIPLEPYDAQDGYVIDAGGNNSFFIWSSYDYNTDKTSIKAIKYSLNGTKTFEKDLITNMPYAEDSDNGFGVVSDGANGFIVVWSSSPDGNYYSNISRFDSDGILQWSNRINNGESIFGGENEAKIIRGKAFVLYANSEGKGYFDSFDLGTGERNQIDAGITASGDFIAEVAKTSDDKLIVFYGNAPYISYKKIDSSGNITNHDDPYTLSGISNDGDRIALPADGGGAYLVYSDSANDKLMVLKVDSNLAGVVKEVDGLYKQSWGDYTYDAIHTPHGLIFAYTKSSSESYVKFVDDSFTEIKKDTYTFTFNDIKLSYNSNNNVVGLATPLNKSGADNIYVAEYKATDGTKIVTPLKAIQNIYGVQGINGFYNYRRMLNLGSAGDNFILNYISPENSYIQQVSTYVVLNTPTDISTAALATNSITFNWTENNIGVNEWYVRYSTRSDFDASLTTETYTTSNPYQATGLKPNTTYYFEVKSSSGVLSSGYSTPYSVSTLVVAPTVLTVQERTSNSLTFSWNSNSNGDGTFYNIVLIDDSDSSEVASSTATALSHMFDSLTANKFYSAKVRAIGNNPDDISDYTSPVSTKTFITLEDVTDISFTTVDTDTIKVEWAHESGALRYDVQSSSIPGFGIPSVIITSNTANNYAVFGNTGEGTLTPNTTYYFRLKAYYNDEEAGYLNMGSTSTLAAQPTGFDFDEVYTISVTLKWNSSNPEYTVYNVRYESDVSTGTKLFSDIGTGDISATITSLKDGTTYTFYLSAINNNSIPTAEISITTMTVKIINAVEEIGASGGQMSFDPGTGSKIDLNFPANTFISITTVTVKLPDTPPSSNRSLMGNITPTGISFEIDSGGVQPSRGVEISINYSGITVDENTLVIARYDSVNNLWIPLKSYVDKSAKKVTAYTDHFSVFSLFSLTPASTISEPKVAPNPLRPSKGLLYSKITFSNLPADTEIIIYNVSGTKVRKLKTDSSGMAVWDGKNDDGKNVASGVYFALIKKGSSTKTIKLGVQR